MFGPALVYCQSVSHRGTEQNSCTPSSWFHYIIHRQ